MNLGQLVQDYGYTAIAIGTFLEGEAILLSGGFAAHRGYLSLPIVIAKHQNLIIFSIRFLYGLRIAGPIALGMNPAIRWPTYSALNGLGAVVWAIVIAGIGYLFGQTIE